MENPKVGDIVVEKKDIGEKDLIAYVVLQAGDVCLCSPWMKAEFTEDNEVHSFMKEAFPPILLHKRGIASICSLNTTLLGPLCGLSISKLSFLDKGI